MGDVRQANRLELGQGGHVKMEPIQRAAAQMVCRRNRSRQKSPIQNASIRYWAALGLAHHQELRLETKQQLRKVLTDPSPAVRIEAANTLVRAGDPNPALRALIKDLAHENLIIVTHAARTIELLGPRPSLRKTYGRSPQARRNHSPA